MASLLLMALVLPMTPVNAADKVSVTITTPSDKETKIAQRRSFYVMGTLEWSGNPDEARSIELTLTKDGEIAPSRKVGIVKDKIEMKADYDQLNYYDDTSLADIKASKMPDIVYDKDNEDSFKDPEKKAYFDDECFNILVAGGVDEDTTQDKAPYNPDTNTPLLEGTYTISVVIRDERGVALGEAVKPIEIGVNGAKLISRFSPDAHKNNVAAFAYQNGFRMFQDAFPGYWSFKGADGSNKFVEILPEWRAANMEEYREGKVNFIVYNVSASSATYSVELGMLQKMNHVNDEYMTKYYYQFGEPILADGTVSSIIAFASGDKLELTRSELGVENSRDNMYIESDSKGASVDLNLKDGVVAEAGATVSLYGVTAPVQAEQADILLDNSQNVFQVNNKISKIKYQISDGAKFQSVLEKDVKLERGKYPSELEFKHDIPVTDEMQGKTIQISISGYDVHGNFVQGTEETISLAVPGKEAEKTQQPPVDKTNVPKTGEEGSATETMILFMFAGILISSRLQSKNR